MKNRPDNQRIAVLENSNVYINKTLEKLDQRLDSFEKHVGARFDKMDTKLDQMMRAFHMDFWGLVLLILGTEIGIVLAAVKHWL